jgi:hypothetical protein
MGGKRNVFDRVGRGRRNVAAWLVVTSAVGFVGYFAGVHVWEAYQNRRADRILECEAGTFEELRSALGRPSEEYEAGGWHCWRYVSKYAHGSWCSSDGVNVEQWNSGSILVME